VRILASARSEPAEMEALAVVARKMIGPFYTPYIKVDDAVLSNKTHVASLSNGPRTNSISGSE
jgi:hypothetical protein